MSVSEVARLAYQEQGEMIRHFSSVRSALTTFLLTVALASYSAYFADRSVFLMIAGSLFLLAAIGVCLIFSYRTEKTVLRYKHLWDQIRAGHNIAGPLTIYAPTESEIWGRMRRDKLNYLLILMCLVIATSFFVVAYRLPAEKDDRPLPNGSPTPADRS